MRRNIKIAFVAITTVITLSACGGNDEANPVAEENQDKETSEINHSDIDHSEMDHSSSGDLPKNLKEAKNPTYEVGSKAIITDGHMEGMEGAEATIVGAYDTFVYAISYTPTTGGKKVTNHKWVIHEEFPEVGEEILKTGTEAVTNATHMTGMEGVNVKIDSFEKTTVYMINFTPTTGGEEVINHKWVTESELSPVDNNHH